LNKKGAMTDYYTNFSHEQLTELKKYISEQGKILPRRLTRLNAKQQRQVARRIKQARILGFLPFSLQN
jgi:small subunit ribosomal protein S18